MTSLILQTIRVVVDPLVWDVLLIILGSTVALGLVYLLRIHIAYRMAKNRHRDPLGWVLLSFFFSPLLTWIILFIIGDNTTFRPDTD
ncbi:hypothetical protein [Alistipes sp. An66]|uniref:hypothetical protein n=1 Tax=Alistipes sp. An66 TaxID=1965650 RepID=UPI000B3AAA74|nr:hypothetical protein [Alistipes sp. An66]OUN58124.1 hypothetical protein B5G16_09825 [Alistipes sp. An66]